VTSKKERKKHEKIIPELFIDHAPRIFDIDRALENLSIRPRGSERKEIPESDAVNSPAHYNVGGIETIDFIEAKKLSYHLGNVVKYVSRAGHKGERLEDLKKARWYLNREIERMQEGGEW